MKKRRDQYPDDYPECQWCYPDADPLADRNAPEWGPFQSLLDAAESDDDL